MISQQWLGLVANAFLRSEINFAIQTCENEVFSNEKSGKVIFCDAFKRFELLKNKYQISELSLY